MGEAMSITQHLIEHAALGVNDTYTLAAQGIVPNSCGGGITVTSWDQVQTAHDTLKVLGGGDISFSPKGTFTVPVGGGVNIDTSFVGIKFNKVKIDASALLSGQVALTFYGSVELHTFDSNYGRQFNREFTDLWLVGSSNLVTSVDSTALSTGVLWDAPNGGGGTLKYSNRCQLINPVIEGFTKAVAVKSGSYMVRVKGGHITRNYYGIFMEAGASDFAEIFGWEDTVFAENSIHLYDVNSTGNLWRFNNCHFDYHQIKIMEFKGSRIICEGCHFEWSYGGAISETTIPFKFNSSSGQLYINGGTMAFLDGTNAYQPYYAGVFDMSANDQVLEITDLVVTGLGRRTETASFDSLVHVSATGVVPQVRLKLHATGTSLNDLPSMSMYVDQAAGFCVGGILRNAENPFNELNWRTSTTGTAVISSVTTDENGVSRKNGQSMMKITGAGKVTIAFPLFEPTRRHAWEFFTATSTTTSVFAGSVTIKERQGGFAPKFDGSTVTWVADSRGAQYGAATININTSNATWVRRSWKNCTDRPAPRLPMNVASCVLVEIDTTGMTAGAIYISHPAFDLI